MFNEERLKIMKTTMRHIIFICLLAFASVVQAVEYKPFTNPAATLPSSQFQSTSVFAEQWSKDDIQPMLNADGSVNAAAYMGGQDNSSSGPRRVGGQSGTPGQGGDKQPLGDALIPLLLLALAYAGARIIRSRRMKKI